MALAVRTKDGHYTAAKSWPLAGTQRGNAPTRTSDVLSLGGSLTATYAGIYSAQPWVNAVINKLSRGLARSPLKSYAIDSEGSRERLRTGPVFRLFRNPYPGARTFQLIEAIFGSYLLYGNALCVKFRGQPGRTPTELWPVPWHHITVIQGEAGPVAAYRYDGPAGRKFFVPEDVVHFRNFNPNWDGQMVGLSPLEPLRLTLTEESMAKRYSISSFGNNARPSSVIISERALTREQREELRSEIDAAYGGPDNAWKTALLDGGLTWQPLGFNAHDMQAIDHRRLTREEVCAVYDVPPPMVHILDRATYSNITEQHWSWYMDSLGPLAVMFEDTTMAQFIDPEPAWNGTYVEFDLNEMLRGNIEQRSQAYQRMFLSGIYTPNELRAFENLEPVTDEGADSIYVPVNAAPVGVDPNELRDQGLQSAVQRMIDSNAQTAQQQAGKMLDLIAAITERESKVEVSFGEGAIQVPAPEVNLRLRVPGEAKPRELGPSVPEVNLSVAPPKVSRIEFEKDERGRNIAAKIVHEEESDG